MVTNMIKSLLCIQQRYFGSSSQGPRVSYWDCNEISKPQCHQNLPYAVMILNRPLTQDKDFMMSFWNNAIVRILVDGGAVRWESYLSTLSDDVRNSMRSPELLTGDFDSITDEVMQKYKNNKGCEIVPTPNQDYTDFTKGLLILEQYRQEKIIELDNIVALAQSSGRFDQIIANIQTLYLAKKKQLLNPKTKLFLMKDDALSWLLSPGEHVIYVPEDIRTRKGLWCSLVPMAETCDRISTEGLKWNLDNATLKFGDLVSTSNTFVNSDIVRVRCSNTVLWSMRIPTLVNP